MQYVFVMKILFYLLSQNGIVAKDLSRLKMLFSEIEVSVCSCRAANLIVVLTFPPLFMPFGACWFYR